MHLDKKDYSAEQSAMVNQQIRGRGILDEKIVNAMVKIPREQFIPSASRMRSYEDGPVPIGYGQTISQPYIVAYMTDLLRLRGDERVLEIGTGSGYQAAVLAEIVKEVYTVEFVFELGIRARKLLEEKLQYKNIHFRIGDGREGWPEFSPFDRIILTASPEVFPRSLFDQLKVGGIAIGPVGGADQRMMRYKKEGDMVEEESLIGVYFVPCVKK